MAKAFLRVVSGARQGLSVPLRDDQPLLIGRNRGDLLLDDPLISGTHCRVVSRSGKYVVQDLGSTNGTNVDGRRIQDAQLRPGSEIVVGNTRLILFSGDESEEAAPDDAGRVAWLLEEDVVAETEASSGGKDDVIGRSLRLPPRFEGRLEGISGPDAGRTWRFLRGTLSIGRKQGEIPLNDPEISRRHAFIEVFGTDMVYLRDAFSTNGTYHNGRRVQVARLSDGDTVGCGKSVMRYSSR
jgi:pSer/pThr/pTyr-binding forkhead associated (FHA) protein